MKMSEAITTCKDKVGIVLAQFSQTRDSDKLLWLAYLCKFHGLKQSLGDEAYLKLKEIIMNEDTPTMESIRRVRQKYQEHGMYEGEHRKERIAESESVRDIIRG